MTVDQLDEAAETAADRDRAEPLQPDQPEVRAGAATTPTEQGIGFIPWYPIAAGELARPGGPVDEVARATGATPGQVALAWLLARSPVMLPIPGTSQVAHLEENVAAAGVSLTEQQVAELTDAVR